MSIQINEVKDLINQFDGSSLREFSYTTPEFSLSFSKNKGGQTVAAPAVAVAEPVQIQSSEVPVVSETTAPVQAPVTIAEGEPVKSPLVGVAYLRPAPDKADFVAVGDTVKKGQTLLIIEAMKVMNEIPAPRDGLVTEILVASETMVEYGEELVRIK
jgi:acetyl-CoA carboxylase biotin carboxyl carrier protein